MRLDSRRPTKHSDDATAPELNRRGFLRGEMLDAAQDRHIMRPPGAMSYDFERLCQDCTLCHDACPEGIIVADNKGRPVVSLAHSSCTFCGACAETCPTGALQSDAVTDWPWRASVAPTCFSLNGIACRSCQDACEVSAIRFQLMTGGRAEPLLDQMVCTGCGACASVCPADAVAFVHDTQQADESAA
ncbi:ferredoxin-type protein NapF [uncultured Ruegeria sp.]|jgi:ferredoxin-type protein NapF|uniref:ferredoxin-type protein NapF n=1 Tax=uncultured Ruegeria sp. TaxID=259304 RepID=UPI003453E744